MCNGWLIYGTFDACDNNYGRKGVPMKLLVRNHVIIFFVFTYGGISIEFVTAMC